MTLLAAGLSNPEIAEKLYMSVATVKPHATRLHHRNTGSERFFDAGEVITAAGISAGIDMVLHLVDRLADRERTQEVRLGVQYDPTPPV